MSEPSRLDLFGVQGEASVRQVRLYNPTATPGEVEAMRINPAMFRGVVRYARDDGADEAGAVAFRAIDITGVLMELPPLRVGLFWYAVQFRSSDADAWQTLMTGGLCVREAGA